MIRHVEISLKNITSVNFFKNKIFHLNLKIDPGVPTVVQWDQQHQERPAWHCGLRVVCSCCSCSLGQNCTLDPWPGTPYAMGLTTKKKDTIYKIKYCSDITSRKHSKVPFLLQPSLSRHPILFKIVALTH